ncbi:MAG: carboxyl transferase domain-containing protein [Hellea sp.]|nr:carboxyl transferase domain-containing protein [Hellea sp.]|tara:strand:- start:1800 stop:3314 length:1515 start_codon:yes stop_codon:yes gene_type:complete
MKNNWKPEITELQTRQLLAEDMGGSDKVIRQKERGKLNVRERLNVLLDDDSFFEFGQLAGKGSYSDTGDLESFTPSNFIFGRGDIDGRPVVATGDDFTVRGGAADASIHRKFTQAEQMAAELRIPILRMIDGTGGGGSVKMIEDMGFTYVPYVPGWEYVVKNLDSVPVVALSLGPTAGLGAARVVASHYSVMVKNLSQVFTAGPSIVEALGEKQNKESLGGSHIHTRNGVIDDEAQDEYEAIGMAKRFLSYLPSFVGEKLERLSNFDPIDRADEELLSIVPRDKSQAYNMRRILNSIVDKDSIFEMGNRWGRAIITAFARLDGWPVAILASDPTFLGGSWTADTAEKTKRFIDLADKFGLPVIHMVDNPGFMVGLDAERSATIRRGVETMNSVYKASVPWATIIIRKAYGVAGSAMSNHTRFQYRFGWPSGDWGSLPLEGGVEVAYQAELLNSADPQKKVSEIKSRLEKVASPFRTAEKFAVENIIDPRATRKILCDFVKLVMR